MKNNYILKSSLGLITFVSLNVCSALAQVKPTAPNAAKPLVPTLDKDYTYGFWKNGFRKHADQKTQDVLCIETGYFGLQFDMAKPRQPKIGSINDQSNIVHSLGAGMSRLDKLPTGALSVELDHAGQTYRLVETEAGLTGNMVSTGLWESGTVAQHFDIQKLIFKNDEGKVLACNGTLDIQAWPKSISFKESR